jgi:glycosyltransferase involved in cell wall biosynthesis
MSFLGATNMYVRLAAIFARTPVVISCSRSRKLFRNFKNRAALSALNPFTDAWIINAATNMESLEHLWLMRYPHVYLVPNALSFEGDFNRNGKLEEDLQTWVGNRMVVGTCGWISEPKNYDMFLDLAKIMNKQRKDVCFILIGGPRPANDSKARAEHLKHRVTDENLSGFVRLLGPRDDVDYLLPGFSLFAFTSIWEGCPNAVIEAMRASLPIVMTKACDTSLLVDEGKNGFVVENNDVAAMAEKVNDLLDSAALRTAFGARSREIAELNFSADNSAWQFALISIRHLVKKRKKHGSKR